MLENYTIRTEQSSDHADVAALQRAAFENDDVIPRLINDLRDMQGTLSLVAADPDGEAVGHVMVSHAWLDAPKAMIDVMVLSPLGVLAAHQRKGIGTGLINAALAQADALGTPLVFLEGNPKFYGTRGFDNAMELGFRRPSLRIPAGAFQVARLSRYSDDMTGTFVYHDVHWRHGVGLYRD